jgi:hypothetical protein
MSNTYLGHPKTSDKQGVFSSLATRIKACFKFSSGGIYDKYGNVSLKVEGIDEKSEIKQRPGRNVKTNLISSTDHVRYEVSMSGGIK